MVSLCTDAHTTEAAAMTTITIRTPRDLGSAIRRARATREWTQTELAQRARVSRRWLIEVEQGKYTAQFGLILRVFEVLEHDLTVAPSTGKVTGPVDLDEPHPWDKAH